MKKILVLRGGALGDFLVTLPALALLRRRWPAARIELAGHATAAALARDCGLLDAIHSQHEARWSALFAAAPLPSGFATWLGEFDLVVNFWPDPGGELGAHFPQREGQTFLHADAQPSRAPAAAHFFCEPLHALGIEPREFLYPLKIRRIAPNAPYPIALHPGSGSPRKNWPTERWLELIGTLLSPVLVILGEAELESWSALTRVRLVRGLTEQPVGGTVLHLAVNLPLPELAMQLARCRLFLGHDSGVSHLAAACGVPSVLLFGPTNPAIWAPPAPHVRVLHPDAGLEAIAVADVRHAMAEVQAAEGFRVVASDGT